MAELICCYGPTGSFKTAQVHFLAKYIYEKFGKTTRHGSCDGGGWKPLEPDIAVGIIEAWGVSTIENPRSVLRKLSQGYWPKIAQTASGQLKLILVPPDAHTWEKVGCQSMEGLSSMANIIMRDALNKQMVVAGDQRGDKGPIVFSEGITVTAPNGSELTQQEKYSFATPGNYNDAQRAVYDIVTNYRSLPVPYVYFSAHEARGEEEDTRKTIIGPAVVGKAVTSQVGTWVGDLLHADDYFVDAPDPTHVLTEEDRKKGVKQRMRQEPHARYWFIRHPDPITGLLFPAKPRVAPEMIPELLKVFPGGYFEPTTEAGIDSYLKAVEKLQDGATGQLSKWKAEVDAKRAAEKVGGADAQKADPRLVVATVTGRDPEPPRGAGR